MTYKNKFIFLLSSKSSQIVAQLIFGGIFIWASLPKLANPGAFALVIRNYRILPEFLIVPLSYVLPILEFVLGSLVVFNIKTKLITSILEALLLVFIFALLSTVLRGIDINCGCFFQSTQRPDVARSNRILLILRDILFLLPGIIILLFGKKPAM